MKSFKIWKQSFILAISSTGNKSKILRQVNSNVHWGNKSSDLM